MRRVCILLCTLCFAVLLFRELLYKNRAFPEQKMSTTLVKKHNNWNIKIVSLFCFQSRSEESCIPPSAHCKKKSLLFHSSFRARLLGSDSSSCQGFKSTLVCPSGQQDVRSFSLLNRYWGQKCPFLYCCC